MNTQLPYPGNLPVRPSHMYAEDVRVILSREGMPPDFLTKVDKNDKTHTWRIEMHRQMGLTPEQSANELRPFLEAAKHPLYNPVADLKAVRESGEQRHQEHLKNKEKRK